ncbi:GNAT family N-acetyltransferase [Ruegeria sp. HKCCA5929]|uniref:GNAT family N-acetyltransferase n=1 Tax=Ruegeria sp. HKCCA5929 TaxID=2682988 RepID=UPI001488D9A5|nr:GNAT family protein [Ruegeria sp. HKCCA5929]
MIALQPLNRNEADRVEGITLRPDQLKFAGTVEEALAEPAERFDLHQIMLNQRPVGLFKIDRFYWQDYPFASQTDLGLRAVILDHSVQGQGHGAAAMSLLRTCLPALYPKANALFLTVNLENPVAVAVYRRAGFEETGDIWPHGEAGPQYIMSLPLSATAV